MPRPRAAKIETATSRRKLPPRKKPYYVTISPGVFLGYCRNRGHCKWSVRVVRGRVEWTDRFAATDDLEPANGRDVLSYWQAVDDLPRTPTSRVAKHRLPSGHPPGEYDAEAVS